MAQTVRIENDAVVAEVLPERGGMITSLTVGGDQVLYLDEATLDDPAAKVRGGVPILFPVAGRLPDDTFRDGPKSHHLAQHGFARDYAWQFVGGDQHTLEVRLVSNDFTLDSWPWRFDVRFKYKAGGNTLTIEQSIANMENRPMPLAMGLHPYFFVPDADKAKVTISTDATRAWDNVQKKEVSVDKIDLAQKEVDLALLDHGPRETRIERPGRRTLRVTWSEPYSHLVVWTVAGKDFVCVEPWTAAPGALASGEGVPHIGPREVRKTWVAITAME